MSPVELQLAAWLAAFWTAVVVHARHPGRTGSARFAAALLSGAALAHLGAPLLSGAGCLKALPVSTPGCSVLFVPLGVALCTRAPGAFAALPVALAVARLGCLAAGCCAGSGGVPTRGIEVALLLGLHGLARILPEARVPGAVLAGLGLVRLATTPWRVAPPAGLLAPQVVAATWLAIGALWATRVTSWAPGLRATRVSSWAPGLRAARPGSRQGLAPRNSATVAATSSAAGGSDSRR